MNIYKVDNYEVDVDAGYCIMNGERIFTSKEVLQELVRSQWREEKKIRKHKYYTFSYFQKDEMGFEFLEYLSSKSAQPEEICERIILKKLLKDAINKLPPKYAQAGILYFIEGYSEIEIGNILNCSNAMVQYYKKCFLKKLKNNKKLKTYYK